MNTRCALDGECKTLLREAMRRFSPSERSSLIRHVAASGATAGALSALTAGRRARIDGTTVYAPINAVTHSLWPDAAPRATCFSVRHTLLGLAIHQCAAMFWGVLFEALVPRSPRKRVGTTLAVAAATAATAYAVDYHCVPKRLTPGFESHLSARSMVWVYTAIAGGFAFAALLRRQSR